MSVLIAYGNSTEAAIMSDSRLTYKDEYGNIIYFEDRIQKIYKITDRFIIGSVGSAKSYNVIKNINIFDNNSVFSHLENYTYEEWLNFFSDRIKIWEIDKLTFSPYITIGIDSNNKIRMDTFNNIDLKFKPACPKENEFFSIIYLPPNINENFKEVFYKNIESTNNVEKFCKNTIKYISLFDSTVGGEIQCLKVHI